MIASVFSVFIRLGCLFCINTFFVLKWLSGVYIRIISGFGTIFFRGFQ